MQQDPSLFARLSQMDPAVQPTVAYQLGKSYRPPPQQGQSVAPTIPHGQQGQPTGDQYAQMAQNAQRPMPTSQGLGASPLNYANRIQSLNDLEFEEEIQRAKNQPPVRE